MQDTQSPPASGISSTDSESLTCHPGMMACRVLLGSSPALTVSGKPMLPMLLRLEVCPLKGAVPVLPSGGWEVCDFSRAPTLRNTLSRALCSEKPSLGECPRLSAAAGEKLLSDTAVPWEAQACAVNCQDPQGSCRA